MNLKRLCLFICIALGLFGFACSDSESAGTARGQDQPKETRAISGEVRVKDKFQNVKPIAYEDVFLVKNPTALKGAYEQCEEAMQSYAEASLAESKQGPSSQNSRKKLESLKALGQGIEAMSHVLLESAEQGNTQSAETDADGLFRFAFQDDSEYHLYCLIQYGEGALCWMLPVERGKTKIVLSEKNALVLAGLR